MKKVFIISIISMILVMIGTKPSDRDFENWVNNKYKIDCNNQGCYLENNVRILETSRHIRDLGVFMIVHKEIEGENGNQISVKALGVFKNIIPLKDSWFWKIIH